MQVSATSTGLGLQYVYKTAGVNNPHQKQLLVPSVSLDIFMLTDKNNSKGKMIDRIGFLFYGAVEGSSLH